MLERSYGSRRGFLGGAAGVLLLLLSNAVSAGDCPVETVQHYTGAGTTTCPCFVEGEEAGAVFAALPADHFPIEIQSIGIGWGSIFGGSPPSVEAALKVYGAGLPNPGAALYSLAGPVLTDGVINEFSTAGLGFEVAAQPFSVTLEFLNTNAGTLNPSMVHDGNGCQPGKNAILADETGWLDACAAGLSGDWLVFVRYLPTCAAADAPEDGRPLIASNAPAVLTGAVPNPIGESARLEFWLAEPATASLEIFDAQGRRMGEAMPRSTMESGEHAVTWQPRDATGARLERGIYFAQLRAGGAVSSLKLLVQ